MEEERKRRMESLKEWRRLSPEERKKRMNEYAKRKKDEYLKLSPELIIAEAQVHATLYSILAGLMFTASVLFFSIGREILYGDVFAMLTLADTALFVFAALLVDMQSESARRGEMYDAFHQYRLSSTFGTIGGFLMIGNLIVLAFYLRLELGIAMCIFVALCWIYTMYRILKRRVQFLFETG